MEASGSTDLALQSRPVGCAIPLTAMQLRVWSDALRRGAKPSEFRTCAASVRIIGSLDAELLRKSIEAIVQRHESLRTRIISVDGNPQQHIDPACGYRLETTDLSGLNPPEVSGEVAGLAEAFAYEQIDMSVGPLFDTKLLKLSEGEHVLLVGVDHLVCDTVSCQIVSREIWNFYNNAVQGRSPTLPPLPVQFPDYCVWQHQTCAAWMRKHKPYWERRLAGAQRPRVPSTDRSQSADDLTQVMFSMPFGAALSAGLRDAAWRTRSPLPLVVFTAYVAAISRWCDQRDMVLAFVSHGRQSRKELGSMIGNLATILWLRVEMGAEATFIDLLQRLTSELTAAYEHQDFDRLPDLSPLCTLDLHFNWLATNDVRLRSRAPSEAGTPVQTQSFSIRQALKKKAPHWFKLAVLVSDDPEAGIVARFWYRPDLFAPSVIERFGDDVRSFAEAFTLQPLAPLS